MTLQGSRALLGVLASPGAELTPMDTPLLRMMIERSTNTNMTYTDTLLEKVKAQMKPCATCGHQSTSTASLARDIGISVGTLSAWLKGERKPRGDDLDTVANWLDKLPFVETKPQ